MPADASNARLCTDVRYQQVADEGIVLCQTAGEVLVLNEVGTRVLALLDEGLTTPEMAARLAAEFDADTERLSADLADFLLELRAAGVVEDDPRP
jgi:hypothetical protein